MEQWEVQVTGGHGGGEDFMTVSADHHELGPHGPQGGCQIHHKRSCFFRARHERGPFMNGPTFCGYRIALVSDNVHHTPVALE